MNKARRPLAIHGPLTALGGIAGLLAAGVVMPKSCEFSEVQVTRLHVVLPFAMPLSLLFGALWFAKHLAPHPREKPRRWIFIALVMVLAGETLFNFASGDAYNPSDAPGSSLLSWVFFWPLLVGLHPVVLALVDRARAAARVRRASLSFGVARRQVWLIVLASIAPLETLLCAVHWARVSLLAYVVWTLGAAAIPVIAGFVIADGRVASRIERELTGARLCEPDQALSESATVLDLGIGEELHAPPLADGNHHYRAAPELTAAVRGAPAEARRLMASARRLSAIALAVSILGSIASALVLAEIARKTPAQEIDAQPTSVPWFGGC